jgi:hypothetical protein
VAIAIRELPTENINVLSFTMAAHIEAGRKRKLASDRAKRTCA